MNDDTKIPHIKSVETRYLEERETLFRGLQNLDRRSFLKISTGAAAAAVAAGASNHFHSFLPVNVAYAGEGAAGAGFTFAYISDSHLIHQEDQRVLRTPAAARGRRRQQARSPAGLRVLRRRPSAAGTQGRT